MQDWQLILATIFGGGGVVASVIKLIDLYRQREAGQLEREDTVITRWQSIAKRAEAELDIANNEVRVYRSAYADLWRAYYMGSADKDVEFPFDPTKRG